MNKIGLCAKNWQTAQIFEIPNKAENVEAIVMYYTHYVSNDAYQNRESSKTDSS